MSDYVSFPCAHCAPTTPPPFPVSQQVRSSCVDGIEVMNRDGGQHYGPASQGGVKEGEVEENTAEEEVAEVVKVEALEEGEEGEEEEEEMTSNRTVT